MGVPAVVVSGAPASGKSRLGRVLARRTGAALLDQDVALGPLVAVVGALLADLGRVPPGGGDDLDHPAVAAATRRARYEGLLAAAADCLAAGTPTVLVAPFTAERADPAAWRATASGLEAAGGAPVLVWATAPPAVLAARLRGRGLPRDAGKLADVEGYLSTLALGPPAAAHVAVDTARPLAPAQLGDLLRRCGLATGQRRRATASGAGPAPP